LRAARRFIIRTIQAVKIVIRDGRIPRPLRWGGALGLLPVPGPFDEVVLLLVGGILWLFYRDQLMEAWQQAEGARRPNAPESASSTR
jgi:hypothetical protein